MQARKTKKTEQMRPVPMFYDIGPARQTLPEKDILRTTGKRVDKILYADKGSPFNILYEDSIAAHFLRDIVNGCPPVNYTEMMHRLVPQMLIDFAGRPQKRIHSNGKTAMIVMSGGPTSVINLTAIGIFKILHESGYNVLAANNGFKGIYTQDFTNLNASMFSPSTIGVPRIISAFCTPGADFGSVKFVVNESNSLAIGEVLRKNRVDEVYVIGGDSTAKISDMLPGDIRIIHAPKTADFDLAYNYTTPGGPSAIKALVRKLNRSWFDVYSTKAVSMVGMQGRYNGTGALGAAYARQLDGDSPHMILLPDRPVVLEEFLGAAADIMHRLKCLTIVFSEGIKMEIGGELKTVAEIAGREQGIIRKDEIMNDIDLSNSMGNVIRFFEDRLIANKICKKVRNDGLGYDPRQYSQPTLMDMYSALLAGEMAAKYGMEGTMQHASIVLTGEGFNDGFRLSTRAVPLKMIAVGSVDLNTSALYRFDGGVNLVKADFISHGPNATDYFFDYLKPLLGNLDLQPSPRRR